MPDATIPQPSGIVAILDTSFVPFNWKQPFPAGSHIFCVAINWRQMYYLEPDMLQPISNGLRPLVQSSNYIKFTPITKFSRKLRQSFGVRLFLFDESEKMTEA